MPTDREASSAKGFFVEQSAGKRFLGKAADLLFPPALYCVSCGAVIDETRKYGLCDACIRRFGWVGRASGTTCAKCGKVLPDRVPLPDRGALSGCFSLSDDGLLSDGPARPVYCHDCRIIRHRFDRGFTCTSYGLYERMLISDYKEKGRTWLSRRIGEIMADRWRIGSGTPAVDFIVYVPSSPAKIEHRGFDQMALIAEQFSQRSGVPLRGGLLEKVKEPGAMRRLSAEERRQAVHGVYRVKDPETVLPGARVLLLDDVYTTGSTVDACSAALRSAGACAVYVLTFAAGGDYRPPAEEEIADFDI